MYNDNLENEKKPISKRLLNQGWRIFQIKSGKESTSKAGNSMFILTIKDNETSYMEDIFVLRTEGKRWLLKAILSSVGIEKDSEGKFNYELKDLFDKDILGEVIHEPNEFINRNGDTIKTTQHKIVDFKKFEPTNIDGRPVHNEKEVLWDDDHMSGITK